MKVRRETEINDENKTNRDRRKKYTCGGIRNHIRKVGTVK
jgi:hypothetical protein